MNDVVITYETLYEMLRTERDKAELQPLPQTFLTDVTAYLSDKERLAATKSEHLKQLENTKRILNQLAGQRERKIINLAIDSIRTNISPSSNDMLIHEQALLDNIFAALTTYRTAFHQKQPLPPKEEPPAKEAVVELLKAVPKFLGPELEEYGPYEEKETVTLPKNVAEILIDTSKARIIN